MATQTTRNTEQALSLFRALGDETRLRLIERLREGEQCVCDLTDELGASQSRLSFHLKALAHLTRLQVFFCLVRAGKELSVGEIQAEVEIPGPTLSHHLDLLRRAGLVENRKEERYIYYSVKRETVTAMVRLLTACC